MVNTHCSNYFSLNYVITPPPIPCHYIQWFYDLTPISCDFMTVSHDFVTFTPFLILLHHLPPQSCCVCSHTQLSTLEFIQSTTCHCKPLSNIMQLMTSCVSELWSRPENSLHQGENPCRVVLPVEILKTFASWLWGILWLTGCHSAVAEECQVYLCNLIKSRTFNIYLVQSTSYDFVAISCDSVNPI